MQINTVLIVSLVLLWILMLFNLLITLGLSRRVNSYFQIQKDKFLKIGEAMPSFEAESTNGELISSATFANGYTAIVILSPSCAPCAEELPKIVALGQRIIASKVKLAMISVGNHEETEQFLENHRLGFPVISASIEDLLVSKLKAYATPFFYLFNPSRELEVRGSDLGKLESELIKIGALS